MSGFGPINGFRLLLCCSTQEQAPFMAFAAVLADFSFVAFGVLQYTEQGLVLLVVCQGATRSERLSLKMLRRSGRSGAQKRSTFMAFAAILPSFSFVAFALVQYTEQGRVLLVVCQCATRSAWLSLKVLFPSGPSRAPKGGKESAPSPGWRWR